jgi:hypothetical protein
MPHTQVGALSAVSGPEVKTMKKTLLLVLMGLNALMQAGGGLMMLSSPGKMASQLFHVSPSADVNRLMAVIGGATLAFMLLSLTALALVLRERAGGYELAFMLGVVLGGIGIVMLATGFACGTIDLLKGFVLGSAALLARAAASAKSSAGPVRAPASSRLPAS